MVFPKHSLNIQKRINLKINFVFFYRKSLKKLFNNLKFVNNVRCASKFIDDK